MLMVFVGDLWKISLMILVCFFLRVWGAVVDEFGVLLMMCS